MPRLASAILLLWLPACAAPSAHPEPVLGGGVDSLLGTATDGPATEPVGTAEVSEASLRSELATAKDPTEAALTLVRAFDAEERLDDALAVVDAALRRRPDTIQLQVARAGVLRDLGRRPEAASALGDAVRALGTAAHPGLLFEAAELAALTEDLAAANRLLAQCDSASAASTDTPLPKAEVAALRTALAEGRTLRPVRVRDVLGDLRGNADPTRRLAAYQTLRALGGNVAARAEAVLLGDPDGALRSRAVREAVVPAERLPEFCAVALSDPDASVRTAGAARAGALAPDEATALLVPVLSVEQDPATFAAVQATLRVATGHGIELTPAAAADPATRAAVIAEWRTQWER